MEKVTTAARLKQIMQERNIKQVDILELCKPYCIKYNEKMGKSILSQYISGSVEPGQAKLAILGLALNVNEIWLMGYDVQKERDPSISTLLTANESQLLDHYRALDFHGRRIVDLVLDEEYGRCTAPDEDEQPTIQIRHSNYKVSAGTGFDLFEGDDWGDTIAVPDTPEARKADYALTIQGNSMEPVFHNDDIILVKQQDAVDLGQIGIFVLDGSGYIKKNGGDRLISLNDEYDDILIKDHDNCRCVGKVIGRV